MKITLTPVADATPPLPNWERGLGGEGIYRGVTYKAGIHPVVQTVSDDNHLVPKLEFGNKVAVIGEKNDNTGLYH